MSQTNRHVRQQGFLRKNKPTGSTPQSVPTYPQEPDPTHMHPFSPRRVPPPVHYASGEVQYSAVPSGSPPQTPEAPSKRRTRGSRRTERTYSQNVAHALRQDNLRRAGSSSQGHGGSSLGHGSRSGEGAGETAQGVATGQIGGAFGPYNYQEAPAAPQPRFANPMQMPVPEVSEPRTSPPPPPPPQRMNTLTSPHKPKPLSRRYRKRPPPVEGTGARPPQPKDSKAPPFVWDDKDPELDDRFHNAEYGFMDESFSPFSLRGWANAITIFAIAAFILTLFMVWPIAVTIVRLERGNRAGGYNLGGVNGTGQVPVLPNIPGLIDKDTPDDAQTRTGADGKKYRLVFSDEFNLDDRTFYPGDDPFWEAVDMHYWPTGDLEWYSPDAVTTKDGKLVITMTEEPIHNLNFKSGMVQSWNKFCFSSGYMEVSVSLPGTTRTAGFWPAVWTMGNLGRAGYGATTQGLWPYSYDNCDIGTYPNQTNKDGSPGLATTGEDGFYHGHFSFQPGQRLSACTCAGSEHPGPSVSRGRGAPEVDVLEVQVNTQTWQGEASQSFQIAPYNAKYQFDQSGSQLMDTSKSRYNTYLGGAFQQSLSALTTTDSNAYSGNGYSTYGVEFYGNRKARDDGYIAWYLNGQESWTVKAAAIAADSNVGIGNRIIPEEPMSMILNLGIAPSFQQPDFMHLQFPAKMYIDYVRVYQREDMVNIGCSPSDYPTSDYIQKHLNAYSNPNLTTWAQAGYTFPRNSQYDGC